MSQICGHDDESHYRALSQYTCVHLQVNYYNIDASEAMAIDSRAYNTPHLVVHIVWLTTCPIIRFIRHL